MTLAVVSTEKNTLIDMLLANKRSENTKRAYRRDLDHFFKSMTGRPAGPELINEFLSLTRPQATAAALQYKADLLREGLKEATINRRLAALRSFVNHARKIGRCEWDLADVEGEKIQSYRDVSGVTKERIADILTAPKRDTLKGKRDFAILRLLWENALRRGEIVSCNIEDFDPEGMTLAILGKGRGTQKELISLSPKTTQAIIEWLQERGEAALEDPLFTALNNAHKGHRLTGEAIAYIVKQYCKAAGIDKKMSPHRLRHSSITAALEATNGNVAAVQKLSRHAKVETLMIYEDRRENQQKKVTDILSALA